MTSARICFVGWANLPILAPEFEEHGSGGAQLQQTLLAKALVRRGFSVSMVVGDYGQEDGAAWSGIKTYKAYSAREGIPVVRFVHPRWTKLCGALRRADADLYYVSCAGAQVGQVAWWAARNGRRIIFRVASDADCDPARLLVTYWRDRKLYEYGLCRAAAVLAQTAAQQTLLRENYGVDSIVTSSLVDWPEGDLPLVERDISLLWVSNIQYWKRPEIFVELAQRLGACTASMVGGIQPGAHHLYQQIRAQVGHLRNLTFHGQLPYRVTNNLFGRALVFVNTSDAEGFPNTFLQAWSRGTPVVSFFDPDNVIRREGLGHAVANLNEMTAAARRLITDPQHWLEISARCRAFMARRYREDEILAPYLSTVGRVARGLAATAAPA